MAFPLVAIPAGISLASSLFGPKQGQRTEGIADQLDIGNKFNMTFEELMQLLQGDASGESLSALRDALSANSDFQLGQGSSRLSGQLAKRGLAGSPVLGANIGQLGQQLALGDQSQFAQALLSGRNQALSSLPSLVGQGLGANRSADIFQTNRANQFSSSIGSLTNALAQILQNRQNKPVQVPS